VTACRLLPPLFLCTIVSIKAFARTPSAVPEFDSGKQAEIQELQNACISARLEIASNG
jgi:hypothetical protein